MVRVTTRNIITLLDARFFSPILVPRYGAPSGPEKPGECERGTEGLMISGGYQKHYHITGRQVFLPHNGP